MKKKEEKEVIFYEISDFDYFKEKSKAQLLNMIWDLQKEYEKLLKGAKKQNEKQTNDRKSKR